MEVIVIIDYIGHYDQIFDTAACHSCYSDLDNTELIIFWSSLDHSRLNCIIITEYHWKSKFRALLQFALSDL